MLAIRYATLAALAVWLGGMVTLTRLGGLSVEAVRQFQSMEFACGAIIFIGLVVLKFVGPPPHGFFPRLGLVALMLAVAASADVWAKTSTVPMKADIALGFVLLFWYVREAP